MKALVTGGAGFVGSNLTDALIERGDEVVIIDNISTGKRENLNPKAVHHEKDLRNYEEIAPIFKGIDCVFHIAALPRVQVSIENPVESHDNNINATFNVLLAAKEAGVKRVVYSASSSAYGDQTVMPLNETALPSPMSPYGLQKFVGEGYCKVFGLVYNIETVSLRYFNVYGPRMADEGAYCTVISVFLRQKAEGKPMTITGDGGQTRDFTHISDVVQANILASESPNVGKGEVINIGAGNNASVNKIAELVGGETVNIPPRLEPRDTLADNRLAKQLIGWEPKVKLEDGIKRLL